MTPKILAFAGSLRSESFNKKMVKVALEGAKKAGAQVTFADLRDFPMPLFDEDIEAKDGYSPAVLQFKKLLLDHNGFLIASPEYNSGISAVLKNAIDWASRKAPGETAPLACFTGKTAVLMSASPGALGGIRGLPMIRSILSNINVLVLPQQLALGKIHEAFGADGHFKDARQQETVEKLGADLAQFLARQG